MRLQPNLESLIQKRNDNVQEVLDFIKLKNPPAYKNIAAKHAAKFSNVLGAEPTTVDAPSWNNLVKDLFSTAVATKAVNKINADEQRALELKLKTIQEQNAAIDRQIKLANRPDPGKGLQQIMRDMAASPVRMGLVALGLGWLIYNNMPKRRR